MWYPVGGFGAPVQDCIPRSLAYRSGAEVKRLILTGIATLAIAARAFAQGSLVAIDDSVNVNGVAIGTAGNYYTGTFGMEVWELTGATSGPPGIDGVGALDGYNAMAADGFRNEVTYANQTMFEGTFSLGTAHLLDVTPLGSTVVLGLAVWDTTASSWTAMLRTANGSTHAGVIAFLNPTLADIGYGVPPVTPALSGWTTGIGDLVMTTIPEPSMFALAALGAGILMMLRRWKFRFQ